MRETLQGEIFCSSLENQKVKSSRASHFLASILQITKSAELTQRKTGFKPLCGASSSSFPPSLDHTFVTQLPREPSTTLELPRVFHSEAFSRVGGSALLWQRIAPFTVYDVFTVNRAERVGVGGEIFFRHA